MPTCKYCHRDFRNLQAVRGHLRACPRKSPAGPVAEPRLRRQEPGIGSVVEPGSSGSDQAEIYSPTRSTLTSHYLLGMIEAHDLLAVLRKRCHERLPYYKLVDGCTVQDEPTFLDWHRVTTDLLHCEQDVGELVQRASVGRDRVWAVYQRVIDVRERWIPWAEREVDHIWRMKEKKDAAMTRDDVAVEYGLPVLKDQFTRLIDLLRRLTAMTRMGI
ncbi:MAG: hypothetical protein HY281_02730 [Nitrospirae bacterium]|nr:hypothetical protein [Nitrospirota bacterium]